MDFHFEILRDDCMYLFGIFRPEYPEEELEEENIIEDDAELTLNKVDDNIFGVCKNKPASVWKIKFQGSR